MPHKLRKTRKMRGSRTCGYGRVGQHRDTGSHGFRKSGRHKRGWSWVLRYEPTYYGKNGFTSPQSLRQRTKIMNVGQLDQMASIIQLQEENDSFVVNLEELGYTKLLGSGKVTNKFIVKIPSCSKSAAEKIKQAGGQVLMAMQEEQGE